VPEPAYLSLIISAFNAADILDKNLPVLVAYLSDQPFRYEILIVDDGSDDGGETRRVCERYHCTFLRHEKNMGKGAGIRTGMNHASGAFRIYTDADIPYDTDTIGVMLHHLDAEGAPMVIGDRNLPGSSYFTEIPRVRRISSAFFTYFVGTIVTTDFFDTQCGIKGFRAETADILFKRSHINGFTFDVELIYMALKRKIPVRRIPVKLRNQERSTVRVFRHGVLMFLDLFRIKLNHLRGYYTT
jgi:dolichyl-phosphate beta-glucosyltransferase